MINKSADVVLYMDTIPLAGQQGATLSQRREINDITDKIALDWREYLSGPRSWSVKCPGMYIVNQETLKTLEHAFLDNEAIDVRLTLDQTTYRGQGIITDFPLNAVFGKGLTYTLVLMGTGPLEDVADDANQHG